MKIDSIVKFIWKTKWPTTSIMAWVHGNERSWIDAFQEILPTIKIYSWTVYFILANLKAIEKNVRFVDKNMNRCFRKKIIWNTYEEKRAREIKKILNKSDYLLDLHNTSKQCKPFLISEWEDLNKYFPVKTIVSWFDILQPWWSDSYMNNIGRVWLCIECWQIWNNKSKKVAKEAIVNFLKFTWNISWKPTYYRNQNNFNFYKIYITKTDSFRLVKEFDEFSNIRKWETIWYDWKEPVMAEKDWIILFADACNKKWQEWFTIWYKL
jgi:hypothetical protein